jgi:hypothetical protein
MWRCHAAQSELTHCLLERLALDTEEGHEALARLLGNKVYM